jgi:hypothetical protein
MRRASSRVLLVALLLAQQLRQLGDVGGFSARETELVFPTVRSTLSPVLGGRFSFKNNLMASVCGGPGTVPEIISAVPWAPEKVGW